MTEGARTSATEMRWKRWKRLDWRQADVKGMRKGKRSSRSGRKEGVTGRRKSGGVLANL